MKIAAICPTLNRPQCLPVLIHCFEQQHYPDRELLILDDAGQYEQLEGDRWRIVSFPKRFRTMGEKLNAAAALVSPDVEAYAKADDDDFYFPWWLETLAEALQNHDWIQPHEAMEVAVPICLPDRQAGRQEEGKLVRYWTHTIQAEPHDHCYHGCWAYRRDAFAAVGGYPFRNDEEYDLVRKLRERYGNSGDIRRTPFYIYNRSPLQVSAHTNDSEAARLARYPSGPYVGELPEVPIPAWTAFDIPPAGTTRPRKW